MDPVPTLILNQDECRYIGNQPSSHLLSMSGSAVNWWKCFTEYRYTQSKMELLLEAWVSFTRNNAWTNYANKRAWKSMLIRENDCRNCTLEKALFKLTPQIWKKVQMECGAPRMIMIYDGLFQATKLVGSYSLWSSWKSGLLFTQIHQTIDWRFQGPFSKEVKKTFSAAFIRTWIMT